MGKQKKISDDYLLIDCFIYNCMLCVFIEIYSPVHTGLKPKILLSQPPEYWNYKHATTSVIAKIVYFKNPCVLWVLMCACAGMNVAHINMEVREQCYMSVLTFYLV